MKILKMKTKRILAGAAVAILLSQTILSDVSAAAFGMGRVYAAEEEVAAEQAPQEVASEPASEVKEEAPAAEEKATEVKEEASNGEEVAAESEVTGKDQQDVESEAAESSKEETLAEETKEETVETETEETEETETEETEETEELCTKSVYTYSGNGVTVTATLSNPNVIPDDAEFRVTPITSGTAYNAYLAAMDKADSTKKHDAENTVLFDVAFLVNENGKMVEFEPEQGSVQIKITFNNKQLEKIDAKNEEVKIVHLPLKDSVMNRVDKSVDASNISVNDIQTEVLTETKASGETLSFSMNSFSTVGATTLSDNNLKATASTQDLNQLLTSADITADKDAQGNYVLNPNSEYKIYFIFREDYSLQFDNDSVVYTFPKGVNPTPGKTTVKIKIDGDASKEFTSPAEIKDGKIIVTWDKSNKYYKDFVDAPNAWFDIKATAKISKEVTEIVFGTDVEKKSVIFQNGTAHAEKYGQYNAATDSIDYTITIKADDGDVSNVKASDTVSGTLLQYQKDTFKVSSTMGQPNGNVSHRSNGFDYTISSMKKGEVIIINYSAKIDVTKVTNGKTTREQALNSVRLTGDGIDETKETWEHYIQTSSISKNGTVGNNDGQKSTIDWKIEVNKSCKVAIGGHKVTDKIQNDYKIQNEQSQNQYMVYSGNGIKVTAYRADGTQAWSKDVAWNQLDLKNNKDADKSWEYTIPNTNEALRYVITYTTEVDTTECYRDWSLVNHVDDNGNGCDPSVTVKPTDDKKVEVTKTAESYDFQKINWKIQFNVPATGLTNAELKDSAPNQCVNGVQLFDLIDQNSIKVEGLVGGETYEVQGDGKETKLVFKKDGQPGLKGTGNKRFITVTLTTNTDQTWLSEGQKQGNYLLTHKNSCNFIGVEDTAEVTYSKDTSLNKNGKVVGTINIDGKEYPYFQYDIILHNVHQDTVIVEDHFDTSVLRHIDLQNSPYNAWNNVWNSDVIFGGNQYDQGKGKTKVSVKDTAEGITITANVPKNGNQYYSEYKITYYLVAKDDEKTLKEKAAQTETGVLNLRNTAIWDGAENSCEVTYDPGQLEKKYIIVKDDAEKITNKVQFTLTVNKDALEMDPNSDTLELFDVCKNLTILPETIATNLENINVTYEKVAGGYKFYVPDKKAFTLTYTCVVNHTEDDGKVSWSNTASLKGYKVVKSQEYQVTSLAGKGGASNYEVTIIKHDDANTNTTLQGAEFKLLDSNKQPVKGKKGDVTVTTGRDGKATLRGSMKEQGWALEEGKTYYLQETKAPNGYEKSNVLIPFSVTDDEVDESKNVFSLDYHLLYVGNKKAPAKQHIEGTKSLTGRKLKADEFKFQLSGDDAESRATLGDKVMTKSNDAYGNFSFDDILFGKAGTYHYTVSEQIPDEKNGVTYDESKFSVAITVDSDANGQLVAKDPVITKDGAVAPLEFTNTYEHEDGKAILHVKKALHGRDMEADEFSFTLKDAQGNVIETITAPAATMKNQVAEANLSFKELTFTEEGTYHYTIQEVVGNKGGITYDSKEIAVVITVVDDNRGHLNATVTYDGSAEVPQFDNNYETKAAKAQLEANKTLNGRAIKNGEFTFTLTATNDEARGVLPKTEEKVNNGEKVVFSELTFAKKGIYTFEIGEVVGKEEDGVVYDTAKHTATVEVTDNGNGQLVATVSYDDAKESITFINDYSSEGISTTIAGNKELVGRDLTTGEFAFNLRAKSDNAKATLTENGQVVDSFTVRNAADKSFTFPSISFTEAGTYEYEVSEVNENKGGVTYDTSVYTVKVVVKDDTNGHLEVADKTYQVGRTAKKAITFTNKYESTPTSAQFHAKKTLVGRDLVQGEFAFDLVDAQGTVVETIHAPKEDFSEITYETPGIYEYTIVEEIPAEAEVTEDGRKVYKGVTYDTKTVQVTVEVTDNKEGALQKTVTYKVNGSAIAEDYASFVNTYEAKPTEIRLEAAKELVGRNLVKGEFGFELKGTSENARGTKDTRTNSVETDGTGKVNFGTITYTQPGTYEYEIRELIPEGATLEADGFYHYKGITYDGTVYPVTVTVADTDAQGVKTGKLVASVRYEHVNAGTVPTFHNTYHGAPVKAQVKAEKTLVGRDLKANEFAFELVEAANQNTLPSGKVIVGNAVDGTVVFPEITYEEVGTYQYTVAEVVDSTKRSVVFDEKKHNVYVTVTEKVDENGTPIGQLQANVRYEVKDEDGLVSEELPRFVNETVLRNLKVRKSFLNQDNLAETGMVSFQLYRLENGKEVAVDGQTVTLTCANRDENGKYHWTQSELVGSFTGLQAYDENDQLISYMVKETTQGNFTIRYYDQDSRTANTDAAKYDAKSFVVGMDAEVVVENCEFTTYTGTKTWYDFHNKYGVRPGQIQVTLYQRLEGQDVSEAKAYTDKNGKTFTKAISGEDDTWEYSFEHLPIYDDNGVKYIYSVTEDYVTYDGHVTADSANLRYYTGDGNHTSVGFVSGDMNLNNTLTTVNVNGTKVWDDEWDSSKRPESIIVRLVANGAVLKDAQGNDICQEVTADAEGNWSFTFENVPNYYVTVDGEVQAAITYAVTEDPVEGYTAVVTGNAVDGFVITNTYETTKLAKAYIVKVDAADQNKALAGATFGLYHEDGSLVGYYTSDANGIVIADSLKEGNYFFRETAAPAGYKLNQTMITFTITAEQDKQGLTLYVGKVINEKTPETPDNPGGDNPNTPEVLGAKRDILTPDQGQVLGVHRAPKTSDASKALLWMLVMGGSGIGAAIMMAQQRRSRNKLKSML